YRYILETITGDKTIIEYDASGNVDIGGTLNSGGADVAELMQVDGDQSNYEFGDVLALNGEGKLIRAHKPYDTAVVGVHSSRPGLVGDYLKLDPVVGETTEQFKEREAKEGSRVPVGMVGIVYIKVTDENGEIRPGDLLTTSSTPGHAMKCTDKFKGIGAILGKALQAHDCGEGRIRMVLQPK
ncbi:MAG: hypothetical protein QF886_25930, partial [Planctomycetota bacterium]|nr:hypothetical protein [Planctomycetota bacterium]